MSARLRHPLWPILAAALALRLAAAVGVQAQLDHAGRQFLIPGDAEGYWSLAGRIAAGEDYAIYDPPRRALRMPGFPLLLAGVRLVAGDSLFAARVMQAAVGTATCGAVYLLGRTLRDERTGLIGAALAGVWPTLVGFSAILLSETPFALALTLSVAAMARMVKVTRLEEPAGLRPRLAGAMFSGCIVGVSITAASYVRPTWLPAAIVFPVAYWFWAGRTRRATLAAIAVPVAAAVALMPWTVRNAVVTGRFVPTTLWVGPSVYDGLRPGATGESDMRFFDDDRLLSRMSEFEMDREYRRRAVAFARENPGEAARLSLVKLWRYWRPWPGADQFGSWPARLVVAGSFLPAIALATVGAWAGRRDFWLLCLTAGPIVAIGLVHAVFVGSLRYRLPAEYPLCVLSAVGVQWTWPRLGRNRKT